MQRRLQIPRCAAIVATLWETRLSRRLVYGAPMSTLPDLSLYHWRTSEVASEYEKLESGFSIRKGLFEKSNHKLRRFTSPWLILRDDCHDDR